MLVREVVSARVGRFGAVDPPLGTSGSYPVVDATLSSNQAVTANNAPVPVQFAQVGYNDNGEGAPLYDTSTYRLTNTTAVTHEYFVIAALHGTGGLAADTFVLRSAMSGGASYPYQASKARGTGDVYLAIEGVYVVPAGGAVEFQVQVLGAGSGHTIVNDAGTFLSVQQIV